MINDEVNSLISNNKDTLIDQQDQYHHEEWMNHHFTKVSIESDGYDSLDERLNFSVRSIEVININEVINIDDDSTYEFESDDDATQAVDGISE